MARYINFNRDILVAFGLGLCALVTNMFAMSLGNGIDYIPVGNIFLFLSAATLGLPGAFVTCASGATWEVAVTNQGVEFLRLLITCSVLAYVSKKYSRVPCFAVALALWLGLYGPAYLFSVSIGKFGTEVDPKHIFTRGFIEVLLVLVSGVLLLNAKVWTLLTNSARRVNVINTLIHIVTCITAVFMFAVTSVLLGSSSFTINFAAEPAQLAGLMSVFVLGITVPALLTWRLGVILTNNFQEYFSAGLLSNVVNKSFSGLSSEFWRRKSMPEISRDQIPELTPREVAAAETPENKNKKLLSPEHGLCALNRNGTVTFMNRKFKKYCEISSNEVLGKNLASLAINPAMCKRILNLIEETFKKGPRTAEVKINQLPEKLKFYEVRTHKSDAFEESSIINGPDSVIVTVKDISEKRTVESHVLQSQKLESLGILVEGLAHTFNNSLTTIAGQASYAKRTTERPQIEKSLNEILKTAFSAGAVVRQLLEFASGRPGRIKEENIVEVIDERLDLLKRMANENYEITIEKSLDEIGVACDTNLIMQALTNLILNAKESYPGHAGKIIISIDVEEVGEEAAEMHPGTRPGNFARLRVKDFGQGMGLDTLGKAFDPLFTTKSNSGHTGLGLAIVFAIVRAHDGFLTAESQVEKGTSISIYLPLQELSEGREKDISLYANRDPSEMLSNNPELLGNEERILVVEDEQNLREVVRTMLATLGYKVEVCSNSQDALIKAKNEKFDLYLVDTVMPKIQGLELVELLKKENHCKQTLVMTGYGASQQANDPSMQVLHKPFDLDTLAKAVKSTLKKD